ncbi:hypothetical protein [Catellatospora sichuanensis]|uniref:hypothetical protein n=1 Tax=Catellatospora sichuanensis TaxID=1969805 RepID=UPI00164270D7|nr:hypothetical protein [Catellatospora sichuanensis]
MSILITAEPARADIFTPGGPDEAAEPLLPQVQPLADSLLTAYRARAGLYHDALTAELGRQGDELPMSFVPSVVMPDGEQIPIDADLFQTLLELYLADGWAPLAAIGAGLREAAGPQGVPDRPIAGVPALPWLKAYEFFVFTRNLVALLVRESLARIEQHAATALQARRAASAEQLEQAIRGVFMVTTTKSKPAGVARGPGAPVSVPVTLYHFDNRALMDDLTRIMNDAAKQRVVLDGLVRDIAQTQQQRREARTATQGAQGGSSGPAASDSAAREQTLAVKEGEQQTLRQATEGLLTQLKAVIGQRAPLALLVVDGLRPGFQREELEVKLGRALFALRDQLAELGSGLNPERSFTGEVLRGVAVGEQAQVSLVEVQNLAVPAAGPEAAVAAAALARLSADKHLFSLVHEQTWWLLVQSGQVARDSFDYVVLHHYLVELERQTEALEAGTKATEAVLRTITVISAALSITLLVTPLAELVPALAGLSYLIDMALLAYQIHSVVGQLRQLDVMLSAALLAPEAFGLEHLAQLGDLLIARGDLGAGLTEAVLKELLLAVAGSRWRTTRRALIMRGFYADLQTLLGVDG